MLDVIGAGASSKSTKDWHEIWKNSEEAAQVLREIDQIHTEGTKSSSQHENDADSHGEFAAPFYAQLTSTVWRTFQDTYRTPEYVWGKILLGLLSALFIGFSFFQADNSQRGLQNILFSIFMMTSIFTSLVQQVRIIRSGIIFTKTRGLHGIILFI